MSRNWETHKYTREIMQRYLRITEHFVLFKIPYVSPALLTIHLRRNMLVLMSRANSTARPHTKYFNSSSYGIFLNNSLRDIITPIYK